MRLLALLRDWLVWSVPSDVDPSLPQTYAEFRATRGQKYPVYPSENYEIARRRIAELNTTTSPLARNR
jgi:hypothetical protein